MTPYPFAETAWEAYEVGLAPLPCVRGGKTPHNALLPHNGHGRPVWTPYQTKQATPKEIEEWICLDPYANPAIICGIPSQVNGCYLTVLDCDEDGLFREVSQEIEGRHGPTLRVESYQGGHIYLLTPSPVKTSVVQFEGRKIEIKGQGAYVMAWGALHPKNFIYEFAAAPRDIAVVPNLAPICNLNFLDADIIRANLTGKAYSIARRKINVFVRDKKSGTAKPRYITRSEMDMAIILGCVNAGISRETIRHILATIEVPDDLTHYQRLVRDESQRKADANFEFSYRKAMGRGDSKVAQTTLAHTAKLREWIRQYPWSARNVSGDTFLLSLTDRDVLLAHVRHCEKAKSLTYGLDCRSGAEMADCSAVTFLRSTRRLIDHGLVKIATASRPNDSYSNIYQLLEVPDAIIPFDTQPHKEGGRGSVSDGINGDVRRKAQPAVRKWGSVSIGINNPVSGAEVLPGTQKADDREVDAEIICGVFGWGGLRKTGRQIYQVLLNHDKGMTQSELMAATTLSQGAVSKLLQRLIEHGFVQKAGRLYKARADPDYAAAGAALGTTMRTLARRAKHVHEREQHKQAVKERREREMSESNGNAVSDG